MHDQLSLYRHRIQEAFPNLTVHTLRLIDHGQSNDVVVMDEEVMFRFPRYSSVVAEVRREADILRRLRGRLPLPIPDPIYMCLEDPSPGSAFVGYASVPGEPLHPLLLDRGDRADRAAMAVARFLSALHAIPPSEVLTQAETEHDPIQWWEEFAQRVFTRLAPAMRPDAQAQVRATLGGGLAMLRAASIPRVLLHGDPGASNILCNLGTGEVTGMIDFSSVHVGDPALDLASASTVNPRFADGLIREYLDGVAMQPRIQFYRGTFALQEALFGAEHGDEVAYQAGMAKYL